jgi:hypothetical protein
MLVHLVNPDRTPPRYQLAIHVPRRPGNVVRRIRPLGRQPDYPHALSDLQRFLIHAIPRRRATQSTDIQPPRDLIKGKPAPPALRTYEHPENTKYRTFTFLFRPQSVNLTTCSLTIEYQH